MAPLGLILGWGGYVLIVWGVSKWKWADDPTAQQLSISDLVLPSHRTTYINAMGAYSAGGTTSLAGGQAEKNTALSQANADVAYYCNKTPMPAGLTPSPGLTCAAAKTRLSNIQTQGQPTPTGSKTTLFGQPVGGSGGSALGTLHNWLTGN